MKRYIIGANLIRLVYILIIVGGCGYVLAALIGGSLDGVADIFHMGDRVSAMEELFK
jgi:branched-subunit amino acid ABC-type transport system permease component